MTRFASNVDRAAVLVAAVLILSACSKMGGQGCSPASNPTEPATVSEATTESDLLGVYDVQTYERSEGDCDTLVEIPEGPTHLVLYHFQPADGGATRLGGVFCTSPSVCRALAERAAEPAIGYSFLGGDDDSGFEGWAILETGSLEDKCRASVQSHALTSPEPETIQIETKTLEVFFEPASKDDTVATCSHKQAIAVASRSDSCASRLALRAERATD